MKWIRTKVILSSDITAQAVVADSFHAVTERLCEYNDDRRLQLHRNGYDHVSDGWTKQGTTTIMDKAGRPTSVTDAAGYTTVTSFDANYDKPIAMSPLSIQRYCYGWDLTKNICEVYGCNSYMRTAFTYTLYGSVTSDGDVTQPLQWGSEHIDEELGLTYYNYRHYNPLDGRWISRDLRPELMVSFILYRYADNNVIIFILKLKYIMQIVNVQR